MTSQVWGLETCCLVFPLQKDHHAFDEKGARQLGDKACYFRSLGEELKADVSGKVCIIYKCQQEGLKRPDEGRACCLVWALLRLQAASKCVH